MSDARDGPSRVGVVQSIVPEGKHGPYAAATVDGLEGSVTFSLNKDVWREESHPTCGTHVVLSGIHWKNNGWRAAEARFFRPEDLYLRKEVKH